MTQEEKLSFASTLGAMMPYKLWCRFKDEYTDEFMDGVLFAINDSDTFKFYTPNKPYMLYTATIDNGDITPYLRPLDGMDSSEKIIYDKLSEENSGSTSYHLLDWLNEKKFDYKNWIENGIALPMSELKKVE